MITRVRLKNWRSHSDSVLDFTMGTNALLGILGSGKSSVLDAVCFCLFGTFPNLQGRKIKIEDVIMKKPIEKEIAEVEVFFKENGKDYSVKRTINRGRGTTYSEVKENGKIIESPNTSRVNELVEKLLKVNYDLFSKAIYSEQNSLDYFLTIPKGQRMKKIDELLMIDKFENARKNCVSLVNKLIERKAAKQNMIEGTNVEESERTINELKRSIESMRSEVVELENKVRQVSMQRRGMEKEMGEAKKIRDEVEALKREEKGIVALVEDTYSAIEEIEKHLKDHDKDSVERELREVTRYLSETDSVFREERRKYENLQKHITKTSTEIEVMKRDKMEALENDLKRMNRLKETLKEKKLKPEKLERDMDAKKKKIEKFIAEMEVMKMKVKELQETITELDNVKSKCPTCDSRITKEKKIILIKRKKFEMSKMKDKFTEAWKNKDITHEELKKLEESAEKLDEMLKSVKDFDKIQSELNSAKNIYAVLKEQLAGFELEFNETKEEVENMEKKIKDARGKKETLDIVVIKLREYNVKKEKIQSLLTKRRDIQDGLRKLEGTFDGDQNVQMDEMWKQLVTQENEMSGRMTGLKDVITEKESRLRQMESSLGIAMKELNEVRKIDNLIEQIKIFEKSLQATQMQLRKEFVTSVNYTMNELWPNLYPYHDFTGLQLSVDGGDYILQLQEKPGKWVNVEGFASGGERSIAALTLRISFALVLAPQLKWLVLDEPTANMDVKAVEDLATTLSEHIGDFIEQTFLITHDEKLEKAVTGYAYRFERDKGKNEPTRVVQM